MNKEKIYRYGQLKILENKLKSLLKNNSFKRIYESNKNNYKETITTKEENISIFSDIPKDIIEYLKKTNNLFPILFDEEKNEITIKTYWDILDTIRILLSIIEFDLIKSYID